MATSLAGWFEKLAPRERQLLTWGGIAAILIVLVGGLLPLQQRAHDTRERVERKRNDLEFVQSAAPEILAAGPVAAGAANNEPLVVLVDRVARESGLGAAISSSEPAGDAQLRLRLTTASFDNIVAWLARLSQQYGIRVSAATVDATGTPGVVNATLELHAAR